MRRSVLIVFVLAALVFPGGVSAAPIRECGNFDYASQRWTYGEVFGAGIVNLTTRRVWCSVARPLSRNAHRGNRFGNKRVWRYKGWRCKYLIRRYEYFDTRCTKRRRHIVRWQSGS